MPQPASVLPHMPVRPSAPLRGRFLATLLALILAITLATFSPGAAPALGSGGDRDRDEPAAARSFKFKVGTFNVLGSQHTARPGGFLPGHVRAGLTADLVEKKGIDVVGFQEVQADQLRVLGRDLDDYLIWPYQRLGMSQGLRLQIAYRRSDFKFVEGHHFDTMFAGNRRPIPYVRLEDRASGKEFWFLSLHNSRWPAERARAENTIVRKVNELRDTGIPVVVGGDTNEWFSFACELGHRAEMRSANPAQPFPACRAVRNQEFDYLLANPKVAFSRYRQIGGPEVWRASDHKLVTSKVRLTAEINGR